MSERSERTTGTAAEPSSTDKRPDAARPEHADGPTTVVRPADRDGETTTIVGDSPGGQQSQRVQAGSTSPPWQRISPGQSGQPAQPGSPGSPAQPGPPAQPVEDGPPASPQKPAGRPGAGGPQGVGVKDGPRDGAGAAGNASRGGNAPRPGRPGAAGQSVPASEPALTTEVYRPAAVATSAVAGHPTMTVAEPVPLPSMPPSAPPPPFQPNQFVSGLPNGQLANPFGGSAATDLAGRFGGELPPPPIRPPTARPTARPAAAPNRGRAMRAPRKASLQIRRFDPWSVLKLSLVLSVAMFLMWLVAVGVLYGVLNGMGVWDKLNGAWDDLASVNEAGGGAEPLISAGRVFGVSAVIGAVNIVLFTAFATVSAFIYNVSADLAGGIEVTLSERD